MMNSTLFSKPKQRQIYLIYASRNYTQSKTTPRTTHLKLPNCSPQSRINDNKLKKKNSIVTPRIQRSQQQSPVVRQQIRIRDSSESIMKELELSGNEDLKDINKSLLLTSQEINKKMQFSIESYLNNTLKQKKINHNLNNMIEFDLTQDNASFHSFEFSRSRRETPLQPIKVYHKK
ncbi:unnamed protein product [Paramecium octaurelia]|uniref:Uncharacterized protein n=1 Tax=Paramecium octaurelia TaxID=43137 RepID=A0A8S1VIQ6_PAROT|nr:unnamed protein product [Paramecium octaurelia]